MTGGGVRRSHVAGLATVLGAWAVLSLAVNLPPHVWALFTGWHLALALEVGAAFGLIALWRGRRGTTPRALAHGLAALLVLLVALRLADLTARSVVARPLNLFLDVTLLPALADVAETLLGPPLALGLAVALGVGALALHLGLARLLAAVGRRFDAAPVRRGFYAIAAAAVAVFAVQTVLPKAGPDWRPVAGSASRAVAEQAGRLAETLDRRAAFRLAAVRDPTADIPEGQVLAGLDGVDVLVIFIESYGVSAVDDSRYASVVEPRLRSFQERATGAGWSVTSGRLLSPTAGGQSWLAHASLTSGLWISDQTLYSLFLAEAGQNTLVRDAARSGRETVQLMPAITLPWPEGRRLGFDRTYEAGDFGYEGPDFYWGIVPDQFALDVLADRELSPAPRPTLFALAALSSSHAPWLPVPEVVAWEALGDGSIYRRWTEGAPAPREVWRDYDAVRRQYALSVAHSLDAAAAFVAERIDRPSLVIILGDHQPAPLITGPDASRAVPVHVMARDPALVAPFRRLGFRPGMVPPKAPAEGDDALPRMDAVRAFLLEAFGRSAATAAPAVRPPAPPSLPNPGEAPAPAVDR